MRTVNEIFYSLQGEGARAGTPAVFIRFCGCNLQCPFCDTDHHAGQLLSDEQILDIVSQYNADWVILTGGEPALAIDAEFVNKLKRAGWKVAIETNGTIPLPPGIDWITVSPKSGIAGVEAPVKVSYADEIKVVDVGQSLEPYFDLSCRGEQTLMFLQPCYVADFDRRLANQQRTVERVLSDPRWRLSVQVHRILSIR